ncbi:hypothetical protein ABFP60_13795 [Clostridioides difficile]
MYIKKWQKDNSWKIVASTFSTIVSVLIVIALLFSMGNKLVLRGNKVKIVGISSMTIDKNEIQEVELIDNMPKMVKRLKGNLEGYISLYKLDNGEEAYVYKKSSDGPIIRITCEDKKIYISFGKDETVKTYNELIEFIMNK